MKPRENPPAERPLPTAERSFSLAQLQQIAVVKSSGSHLYETKGPLLAWAAALSMRGSGQRAAPQPAFNS